MLKWMLEIYILSMWAGCNWLWIESSGGLCY